MMSNEMAIAAPRSEVTELLAEAPAGRHIGHVHRGRPTLMRSVYEFAIPGLLRGEAVVIIASAFHTPLYLGRLRERGLDPCALTESGQLIVKDAQELLGGFVRNGMPRWEDFVVTVGSIIGSLQGNGWKGMRVYDEGVSDLLRARNIAASLRLEAYWNDLSRLYPFCLLCCYDLGDMDDETYWRALGRIGKLHSDLIPVVG